MKRRTLIAGVVVVLLALGLGAAKVLGQGETTGTATFTNVVTYTIPTVTQTVTVTTTAPTTTTSPPPAATCTQTISPGTAIGSSFNALSSGDTLCLNAGTYTGFVDLTKAGVTMQAAGNGTATVCGELDIEDSADNIAIKNLTLDGSCGGTIGIYMRGENTLLQGNEITNRHQGASCILVGQSPAGWDANNVIIRRNVIHDCGVDGTRDQGIYFLRTTGSLAEDNTIYNTSAFAMQYWGQVTNTRYQYNVSDGGPSTARGNLIVGADSGTPPSGNFVNNNIISYTQHAAFEGGFGGTNNVVSNNCVFQTQGIFSGSNGWTDGGGNVSVDPLFVDRASHNYALQAGSPCAGKGPR